jgi:hypothetical protein
LAHPAADQRGCCQPIPRPGAGRGTAALHGCGLALEPFDVGDPPRVLQLLGCSISGVEEGLGDVGCRIAHDRRPLDGVGRVAERFAQAELHERSAGVPAVSKSGFGSEGLIEVGLCFSKARAVGSRRSEGPFVSLGAGGDALLGGRYRGAASTGFDARATARVAGPVVHLFEQFAASDDGGDVGSVVGEDLFEDVPGVVEAVGDDEELVLLAAAGGADSRGCGGWLLG